MPGLADEIAVNPCSALLFESRHALFVIHQCACRFSFLMLIFLAWVFPPSSDERAFSAEVSPCRTAKHNIYIFFFAFWFRNGVYVYLCFTFFSFALRINQLKKQKKNSGVPFFVFVFIFTDFCISKSVHLVFKAIFSSHTTFFYVVLFLV